MNGSGIITNLKISNDLIDKDDPETLQDVVVVAINEARNEIEQKKNALQNSLTGGTMPKGFF